MKSLCIALALAALAALIALAGCQSEKAEPAQPGDQTNATTENSDEALCRDAAHKIVAQFSHDLRTELTTALSEGSPVSAISFCRDKAPIIAASYSHDGWSIRRVSDQYRNPSNRADTTELAFMHEFADTTDFAPEFLVDWSDPDSLGARTFHYYRPIRVGETCLKCHGDLQTLAPGVYSALRKNYPLDKATGYKNGGIRGLFVVTATWPEGREHAERIMAGGPAAAPPTDSTAISDSSVGDETL